MTAEDIELMQEKILRVCNAAGNFGMSEERLLRTLHVGGYEIDAAELEKQLRYLKSKAWIEETPRTLRPDRRHWQSTAAGDEELMRRGLL